MVALLRSRSVAPGLLSLLIPTGNAALASTFGQPVGAEYSSLQLDQMVRLQLSVCDILAQRLSLKLAPLLAIAHETELAHLGLDLVQFAHRVLSRCVIAVIRYSQSLVSRGDAVYNAVPGEAQRTTKR